MNEIEYMGMEDMEICTMRFHRDIVDTCMDNNDINIFWILIEHTDHNNRITDIKSIAEGEIYLSIGELYAMLYKMIDVGLVKYIDVDTYAVNPYRYLSSKVSVSKEIDRLQNEWNV